MEHSFKEYLFCTEKKYELIQDLLETREFDLFKLVQIEHELNQTGLVLWVLTQMIYKNSCGYSETFITCYPLLLHEGVWGYKIITESENPAYYDCPLHFLEKAQDLDFTSASWREKVRDWHSRHKVSRKITVTVPPTKYEELLGYKPVFRRGKHCV